LCKSSVPILYDSIISISVGSFATRDKAADILEVIIQLALYEL